jgi:two-component system LytT family response regulator
MKFSTIIVDDEALGRERLRMLLKADESIMIVAECEGGKQALHEIQDKNPDIVLLDIQMPDLDGFGVITELQKKSRNLPIIIFVTAYDEHAVKAFEVNAMDYLLKPVQRSRLNEALDRARSVLNQSTSGAWQQKLERVITDMQPKKSYLQRIEVKSLNRTDYVNVDDIQYLKSDGNYIELFTPDTTYLARMTMLELEKQLDPNRFIRINRSVFASLAQIVRIEPAARRGHLVILRNGAKINLTRSLGDLQDRLKFS